MGTLTIEFYGICTHIQSPTRTGVAHRCVLVNGSDPPVFSPPIAPHVAFLLMDAGSVITSTVDLGPVDGAITFPLDGIRFTFENTDQNLEYRQSYQSCIPSLTSLANNLPALSTSVVAHSEATLADAYIDVSSGVFDASLTTGGASYAILTQTFDGDPKVHVTFFDNRESGTITLESGATIMFLNIAQDIPNNNADNDDDFLLHYLVLGSLPTEFSIPTPCSFESSRMVSHYHGNIGPGCSNSNYP